MYRMEWRVAFVDDMEEVLDRPVPSGRGTAWGFLAMDDELEFRQEVGEDRRHWSFSSRKEWVGRVVRTKSG